MTDAGYNANQIHPDWYDVVRPTKLPSYEGEFGTDGNAYFSVRQTRLGFKGYLPTPWVNSKRSSSSNFLVPVWMQARPHSGCAMLMVNWGILAWASTGAPLWISMCFPIRWNTGDPTGMVFFRNIQIRYMPIMGDTRLTFALERPGASAEGGIYADRIELTKLRPRFSLPDFSVEYR